MGAFASVFKQLRKEKGLTQDELAEALGITKQAVSHYERGTREPRNQEMLELIADFFNVDINYLTGYQSRTTQLLNDEELKLVNAYRKASEDIKKAAQAVLIVR